MVEISSDGSRITQFLYKVVSRHPDGTNKDIEIAHLEIDNKGTLRIQGNRTESVSAGGTIARVVFGPEPVLLRFPEKGVNLDILKFEVDVATRSGRFAYAFNQTGLREDGELTDVLPDEEGAIHYTYGDPLSAYAGTSTVTNGNGDILFKKTRAVTDGVVTRGYDLGDGITMRLVRGEQNIFRGPLLENGTEVAKVGMVILGDGTTIFDVQYLDDPTVTRRIGYGVMDGSNFPAAGPAEPRNWLITTLAGGEAGMADGNATQARFSKLRYLAPSRQQTDRYYACESGNSRIIQIDHAGTGWSFKTIAGTGQSGDANGPGSQSTFREPTGIAVGPDDTLYVSEVTAHRIRKLKQDAAGIWQSSVLAGSGTAAFADASGQTAAFYGPAGLAFIGTTLYVADQGNARIRQVDLTQTPAIVSTTAGQNTRAERDGTGDAAQFKQPLALAVEDPHTLLIGDRLTNSLRRLDTDTRTVTTLISSKDTDLTPFDGPLDTTGVFNPWGILTHQNRILVGYTTLRVIKDGQIRTIAGNQEPGLPDGDAQTARFTSIFGMAPLSDGTLLVADGNRFRLLTPPRP